MHAKSTQFNCAFLVHVFFCFNFFQVERTLKEKEKLFGIYNLALNLQIGENEKFNLLSQLADSIFM